MIRAYWMQQAEQYMLQTMFEKNFKYISQTEIEVDAIEKQFTRTETRFYLTVGEIDCPTGKIIVSAPLCYLAAEKYCSILEISVAPGSYPAEVSICRHPLVGIRMCTARLKIKDTKVVKYACATPTEETAAAVCEEMGKSKDRKQNGNDFIRIWGWILSKLLGIR